MKNTVGVLGAGRMGRGIALSYIFAGVPVLLVDLKQRSDEHRQVLIDSARAEMSADLRFLAGVGLIEENQIRNIPKSLCIRALISCDPARRK